MACCYIAASMIAFIINSCEALDINLNLQYNESVKHDDHDNEWNNPSDTEKGDKDGFSESGVSIVSISGMTCAACTSTVEQALLQIQGVQQVLVSLALQEARIFHSTEVDPKKVISTIESVGYDASIGERAAPQKIEVLQHTKELAQLRWALQGLVMFSTIIFSLGKGLDLSGLGGWLFTNNPVLSSTRASALFILTTWTAGRYGQWIFSNAFSAATQGGQINMHTLISASTLVGLLVTLLGIIQQNPESEYHDTIIGVILIITIGRYMDLLSRRKASNTFVGLYSLIDETTSSVKLKLSSSPSSSETKKTRRIPASALRSGDEIIIDPYRIIPVDSYVTSGKSSVNESVITGESYPKTKTTGDLLLAGSRNSGPDPLQAMVSKDHDTSFLSQLVSSIETSLTSKASAQKKIDVVTRYFVGTIFAIAFLSSSSSFFSSDHLPAAEKLTLSGRTMMTILSAACPCALGLATPCAVMAGIDVAWRKGILMLSGGETMESIRDTTHVVMDKTGTLTRGTLSVSCMRVNGGDWGEEEEEGGKGEKKKGTERELAVLICAAEERAMSSHPLAGAVFRRLLPLTGGGEGKGSAWKRYQAVGGVRELEEVGGRGVRCLVDVGSSGDNDDDGDSQGQKQRWRSVCVGNLAFMLENGVEGSEEIPRGVEEGEEGGGGGAKGEEGSVMFAAVDGKLAASMVLRDELREDAKATVDELKTRGIAVSMLTGDNEAEACRISRMLGIPVEAACATPADKLEHIKRLQKKGEKVIMIGDGMNDGPSLAAADVGVMMAHGRKCLSSGGSVLILQSQLHSLLTLLDISRSTMRQVSVNITWALTYNVVAVGLAVGLGSSFNISITPPMAATMMSISSTFITIQGLVLRARLSKQHGVSE